MTAPAPRTDRNMLTISTGFSKETFILRHPSLKQCLCRQRIPMRILSLPAKHFGDIGKYVNSISAEIPKILQYSNKQDYFLPQTDTKHQ